MKTHLEYKDEKSAKFWIIEVKGTEHTVTYGKIGTDGQTKNKTFDSAEEATKAAEKLIKAKSKKGYQEVASSNSDSSVTVSFIEQEEAIERFELENYDPLDSFDYELILLIEGNLTLEETLDDDSIEELLFAGNKEEEECLIIFNGNLTINGDLAISGETGFPSLLVLGDIHCDALFSNDNIINITGDAHLKYLFYGNYNSGVIKIEGTTHAPYIINSDHDSDLLPGDQAILINASGDDNDFFDYHYYSEDLPEVLVEEALYLDGEDLEFDIDTFKEFLETGKSPFKEGLPPLREVSRERWLED